MDESPPEAAAASLRDLVRINRTLGGHGLLLRLLTEVAGQDETFSLLDVGAASGDTADLIRRHYPGATVTSLDYKLAHVRGAQAPKVVANAFQLPFEDRHPVRRRDRANGRNRVPVLSGGRRQNRSFENPRVVARGIKQGS